MYHPDDRNDKAPPLAIEGCMPADQSTQQTSPQPTRLVASGCLASAPCLCVQGNRLRYRHCHCLSPAPLHEAVT